MRTESVIAVVGLVLLALLLFGLFGGGFMGWGMMGPGHMWGWDGDGFGFGWGMASILMVIIMSLLPILFLILVVLGIVWLVRSSSNEEAGRAGSQDQALSILRERYARGEITREEFDQMRQDLE